MSAVVTRLQLFRAAELRDKLLVFYTGPTFAYDDYTTQNRPVMSCAFYFDQPRGLRV